MNAINSRLREGAARARSALRGVANWRGPRSRAQVIVAATAATVLAVGVGIVWGIAGATGERADTAGEPFGDPQGVSGEAPGDPLGELASPGAVSEGGDLPGGSGSGSGSGTGPGSSGDGPAGNRPPVIEDPGLSSDGLTLTIAPTVADPDGDPVSLSFEVDGDDVAMADGASTAEVTRSHTEVGYQHQASVVIRATDGRGGVTEDTFTETLRAVTTVAFGIFEIEVANRQECFAQREAWRLTGSLQLYGAVRETKDINVELRSDRTRITLLAGQSATVIGKAPGAQQVYLLAAELRDKDGDLAGPRDTMARTHRKSETVRHDLFTSGTCRAVLSYRATFTTR